MSAVKLEQQLRAYHEYVRSMLLAVKQPSGKSAAPITMRSVSNSTGIDYTYLSKFANGHRRLSSRQVDLIHDAIEGLR